MKIPPSEEQRILEELRKMLKEWQLSALYFDMMLLQILKIVRGGDEGYHSHFEG